jgi:nitric oxide reductase large subunit
MIGFFVNITVTVVLGLLMQHKPNFAGSAFAAVRNAMPDYNHINIGSKRDPLLNPYLWAAMVLVLLFTVPFYRVPLSLEVFVGDMSAWAFVALMLSGVLACLVSYAYMRMWESYQPEQLPSKDTAEAGGEAMPEPSKDVSAGLDPVKA